MNKKQLLLLTVLILESIGAMDELQGLGYYRQQMDYKLTQDELTSRVDEMKAEGLIAVTDEGDDYTLYEQTPAGVAWFKANWG